MMEVREVSKWLARLSADSFVGVDEGGLCLQEIEGERMTGCYLEIGGIPEEIENAEQEPAQ